MGSKPLGLVSPVGVPIGVGDGMKLQRFFNQLWKDEAGQSTTEYILILAVVVMIAMKVKKELPGRVGKVLDSVTSGIDDAANMQMN
jgi:Flp pilus assembly pilin Flp